MNSRAIAVFILGIGCLVLIINLANIPTEAWSILSSWEIANIAVSGLVALASLLVAYWVYTDYDKNQTELDFLSNRIRSLEHDLEKHIKNEKEITNRIEYTPTTENRNPDSPSKTELFLSKYLKEHKKGQSS